MKSGMSWWFTETSQAVRDVIGERSDPGSRNHQVSVAPSEAADITLDLKVPSQRHLEVQVVFVVPRKALNLAERQVPVRAGKSVTTRPRGGTAD